MLQDKVKDLTLALNLVEKTATQKISEVINECDKVIVRVNNEKQGLENKLSTLQAEMASIDQMKAQLKQFQSLEDARNGKIRQLEQQVELLQTTIQKHVQHIELLQKREGQLIAVLKQYAVGGNEKKANGSGGADAEGGEGVFAEAVSLSVILETSTTKHVDAATTSSFVNMMDDGEDREDGEIATPPSLSQLLHTHQLLTLAEERVAFLEKEVADHKRSLHDLIVEIETVSNEESNSRKQTEILLKQVQESQSMQRAALEENLKLTNSLEEMVEEKKQRDQKYEMMKGTMVAQDQLIQELKGEKQALLANTLEITKHLKECQKAKQEQELVNEELTTTLKTKENELQIQVNKQKELLDRCQEVTKQCQQERKLR
jgi:chromosome segregation ATPase